MTSDDSTRASRERSHGAYRLLRSGAVYSSVQRAIGAERSRRILVEQYIRPEPGLRVLDVGAGTGEIAAFLPPCKYTAIEPNDAYFERLRRHAAAHDLVLMQGASLEAARLPGGIFDRVLLLAVLHHLADDEAMALLREANRVLAPGGVILTIDPCLDASQGRLSRFLVARDRGQHVRTRRGYQALLDGSGLRTEGIEIRSDLARFGYTHCIAIARRTGADGS